MEARIEAGMAAWGEGGWEGGAEIEIASLEASVAAAVAR